MMAASRSLCTLSKKPLMSKSSAPQCHFALSAAWTSWTRVSPASVVLECLRVPNCVVGMRWYLSISKRRRLDTPFSISLLMVSSREMGRKFFAAVRSSLFGFGMTTTSALRHALGWYPTVRHALARWVTWSLMSGQAFRTMVQDTPDSPGAVLPVPLRSSSSSSSLNGSKFLSGHAGGSSAC
jgi:hypothetical protein